MTTQQAMKGDIIINPRTQRCIRVGSRVWTKLVNDGVFKPGYMIPKNEVVPNIIYGDLIEEVIDKKHFLTNKEKKSLEKKLTMQTEYGRSREKKKRDQTTAEMQSRLLDILSESESEYESEYESEDA